jgi:hypothetical protein
VTVIIVYFGGQPSIGLGRLGRTLVDGLRALGHAVAVVVAVGAAVVVGEAVFVLGLVGALVHPVGDAVAVVVGIGAAVGVLGAVAILGVEGAVVDLVVDAVGVVVVLGATVGVLEAVLVLGHPRAIVVGVEDAVLVEVGRLGRLDRRRVGRVAQILGRLLDRPPGVVLGDLGLALGREVLALR